MTACSLFAADEARLALTLKAQSEFDRVQLAAIPDLRQAVACIQTQASLLPLTVPADLPLVHFHKGFCTMAGAVITNDASEFRDAAAEFDKAIEGWPARTLRVEKGKSPEQLPPALYVLAWVARLKAGADDASVDRAQAQIASAVERPGCFPGIMTATFCQEVLHVGRLWLGWMALRHDYLDDASRLFADSAGTGWQEWVSGRRAFLARKFGEAASQYRQSIDLSKTEPGSLLGRLGPRPELASELTDLGGAQLLAGSTAVAIATLDDAAKSDASSARPLYYRARAKELAHQTDASLADYNLASRTAFAAAKELASGEAHLYRGILLFRRKDYGHAEDEFASALNFEIPGGLRADATAWRHLAAVSSGSCEASRLNLDKMLMSVSPYFPKDEARSAITACLSAASAGRSAARD